MLIKVSKKYILGIDTSSSSCGYAIISLDGKLEKYGVIKTKSNRKLEHKLLFISERLDFILGSVNGIINAQIEKPYSMFRNAEACLWQVVGTIKTTLAKKGIEIHEAHVSNINKLWGISPKTKREQKKMLTIEAVKKQFNLQTVESDAADAISLAYYEVLKGDKK